MDDTTPAKDSNEQGLNKIDLTQLQAFSFGTQWTEVKPISPQRRDFDREPRERRDDGGGRGAPARDRRSFQKPTGPLTGAPGAGAPAGGEGQGPGGDRRRFDRGPGHVPRRPPGSRHLVRLAAARSEDRAAEGEKARHHPVVDRDHTVFDQSGEAVQSNPGSRRPGATRRVEGDLV